MSTTQTQIVRTLIQDGTDANGQPYNMTRLEDLSDQVPVAATPTQRQFVVRFQSSPVEEYVSLYAVPGSLIAFIDGATSVAPSVDVDQSGRFTLPSAPVAVLLVTYGWQWFSDSDIDAFLSQSLSWLVNFTTVSEIPDGLVAALTQYAAGQALNALARKATLADASAGDAKMDLSALAKMWAQQAKDFIKNATDARDAFYTGAGANQAPQAQSMSLAIAPYQPRR